MKKVGTFVPDLLEYSGGVILEFEGVGQAVGWRDVGRVIASLGGEFQLINGFKVRFGRIRTCRRFGNLPSALGHPDTKHHSVAERILGMVL